MSKSITRQTVEFLQQQLYSLDLDIANHKNALRVLEANKATGTWVDYHSVAEEEREIKQAVAAHDEAQELLNDMMARLKK